jgi:clathrin heavy chain
LLECRRIAALLYRKNKRFQQSIAISKRDGFYQDAMEAVAESRDPVLAEDLLRFVMSMQDKELIATMLYTCYELIKPDVAMEIGWRCGLQEFVMPYFIQFVRDLSTRVEKVQKSTDDIKKKEEVKAEEEANRPLDLDMHLMFPGGMGPMGGMQALPAIMPAAGSMPGMGGMGGMGGFGTLGGMAGGFGTAPTGFGANQFQTGPAGLGGFGALGGMAGGFSTAQQRF